MNNKIEMLLNLRQNNNNLLKCVNILNELKVKSMNNLLNEVNCVSMNLLRISDECNALSENIDKQINCDKHFICFWPKCRFTAKYESDLNNHISYHLQFKCNQCYKCFNDKKISIITSVAFI